MARRATAAAGGVAVTAATRPGVVPRPVVARGAMAVPVLARAVVPGRRGACAVVVAAPRLLALEVPSA
jgi:hypothetical protein